MDLQELHSIYFSEGYYEYMTFDEFIGSYIEDNTSTQRAENYADAWFNWD